MEPECFYIQLFPQEMRKIVKWEHEKEALKKQNQIHPFLIFSKVLCQ